MSRAFRSSVMALLLLPIGGARVFAQVTATITVIGTEQPAAGGWDTSNISITVNGYTETYQYGQWSTANSVASAFSAMFSRDDYQYGLSTGVGVNGTGLNTITFQLNSGSFSQVAISGPTTSFSMSTSGFTSQTTPTLSLTTSGTPSTYGSTVTFTASISSGPSGAISFYDSGTLIGSGTINSGSATLATSALAVGTHSITASWPGNTSYTPVTSAVTTQVVTAVGPPPYIFSLSPNSGSAGKTVVISGRDFGTNVGAVTFSGTPASISSWNGNGSQIVVTVPAGAPTGFVVVTAGSQSSNGVRFRTPVAPACPVP